MIKPNIEELAELTGKSMVNYSDRKLLDAAKDAAKEVRLIGPSRSLEKFG